jgi:pyruvate/2-oxoglutarate/acetoin dehydrogenase E1 component
MFREPSSLRPTRAGAGRGLHRTDWRRRRPKDGKRSNDRHLWRHGVKSGRGPAERLREKGIDIEIVDLRSLAPLDKDAILASVAKTRRAIVLDEGPMIGGVSAEIAAMIQENLFSDLKGPVVRVAAQRIPPPHSPPLVEAMIPDVDQIVDAVMRLAEGGKIR